MPSFGAKSKANLSTCSPGLQRVFNEVVKTDDCSVLCGHRGQADQHTAFVAGNSQLDWPHGHHNKIPSTAADVVVYPPNSDPRAQCVFAGIVIATGRQMGIKIRWGGDWDGDYNIKEHTLFDPNHFEEVE